MKPAELEWGTLRKHCAKICQEQDGKTCPKSLLLVPASQGWCHLPVAGAGTVSMWDIPHVPEIEQSVPDCSHLSPQAMRAASQKSDLCFVHQLKEDELGSFGLWVFLFKKHSKTQC